MAMGYDGGIGAVNIADLPPDIQKQLGFDPQKAAIASTATRLRGRDFRSESAGSNVAERTCQI